MEYDFYYSKICENMYRENARRDKKSFVKTLFNGIHYTEMIEKGKMPFTIWASDITKIGTGTDKYITYE